MERGANLQSASGPASHKAGAMRPSPFAQLRRKRVSATCEADSLLTLRMVRLQRGSMMG